MNKRIYLSPPSMGGREQFYIQEAFDSNWIAPLGSNVDAFEKSLAECCNVKDVAALNSGTAALHLALVILGVEPGDYVIASTFTFSATVNPIVYLKAEPVLVDSEPSTWNMDPELLLKAIKDCIAKGKRPKAIIPVHLYGMPAKMAEIMNIANHFGIPVVEDAAEALGSRYDNKPLGSFGRMSILSFNGNKIITTSGGGAMLSNDINIISKARFLASQARDKAPYYQHSAIGYNYRMSNILAGIGRGQLELLKHKIEQRRKNYEIYEMNLSKINGISFLNEPSSKFFSNKWLTTITINPTMTGFDNMELHWGLEKENIETRPLWKPMHLQPVFSDCLSYINGTSELAFSQGLCLPSGCTESEQSRIIETILMIIKKVKTR